MKLARAFLVLALGAAWSGCETESASVDGGSSDAGLRPSADCLVDPVIQSTADGVEFVRTPDACFEGLPGWPFAPEYVEIDGLRQAYVEDHLGRRQALEAHRALGPDRDRIEPVPGPDARGHGIPLGGPADEPRVVDRRRHDRAVEPATGEFGDELVGEIFAHDQFELRCSFLERADQAWNER